MKINSQLFTSNFQCRKYLAIVYFVSRIAYKYLLFWKCFSSAQKVRISNILFPWCSLYNIQETNSNSITTNVNFINFIPATQSLFHYFRLGNCRTCQPKFRENDIGKPTNPSLSHAEYSRFTLHK